MTSAELQTKIEVLTAEHHLLIRISKARTIDEVIDAVMTETKRVTKEMEKLQKICKENEAKD